mgnify:CR=1 FL=1
MSTRSEPSPAPSSSSSAASRAIEAAQPPGSFSFAQNVLVQELQFVRGFVWLFEREIKAGHSFDSVSPDPLQLALADIIGRDAQLVRDVWQSTRKPHLGFGSLPPLNDQPSPAADDDSPQLEPNGSSNAHGANGVAHMDLGNDDDSSASSSSAGAPPSKRQRSGEPSSRANGSSSNSSSNEVKLSNAAALSASASRADEIRGNANANANANAGKSGNKKRKRENGESDQPVKSESEQNGEDKRTVRFDAASSSATSQSQAQSPAAAASKANLLSLTASLAVSNALVVPAPGHAHAHAHAQGQGHAHALAAGDCLAAVSSGDLPFPWVNEYDDKRPGGYQHVEKSVYHPSATIEIAQMGCSCVGQCLLLDSAGTATDSDV